MIQARRLAGEVPGELHAACTGTELVERVNAVIWVGRVVVAQRVELHLHARLGAVRRIGLELCALY
eukprot:CAMPEP_0119171934 /NCGR_PEP_ID=MMETSP1315-20130426/26762_1 /TAXON_ID=676789 /ORGANISM="Prasinoderma singularis, Strain RCC927" /LENGTH=65 /DNA_ID=CAMNT_0007165801 /DNA_START=139 /DNA_END=333 /DNA_ORIENTATION=+